MKRNTKTIILDILTYIFLATVVVLVLMPLLWIISTSLKPVSYTHLTLPTTPNV